MFRKIAHIISAFILLVSTMGLTVSKHYCCSRLVEVSINMEAKKCCDAVGTSDCCHDETMHYQLDDEFTSYDHSPSIEVAELAIAFDSSLIDSQNETKFQDLCIETAPPPLPLGHRLACLQMYLI